MKQIETITDNSKGKQSFGLTKPPVNPFQAAVGTAPPLVYEVGLQALKGVDRKRVSPQDPRLVDGSVNIDSDWEACDKDGNRWDYAVSYNGMVCFIEVHPADTGNVGEVLSKLSWLKKWLKKDGTAIGGLPAYSPRYVWIASGRVNILPTSSQSRKVAAEGLRITEKLQLK